ncbi:SAM-dependent methyltransferase [Pararhizobium mangrovi]|uniref:Class I SAM-dependent methyltransferase n=1 Tax=Pararhizobium mangrovi TaxID=2590452 RepID=A0A506UFW3_9HYPH|nr:cyclopropane-fatty-acyl-phospholipid synthase family protein [Pararhizobium mangrovi]TPW32034.1 class I SAM-dependent methyltransferase [Pararhizobium mangrovi]
MHPIFRKFIADTVKSGDLTITSWNGEVSHFGDGTGTPVHIRFTSRAAERSAFLDPTLKIGECYMDGELVLENGTIYDFLHTVFSNSGGGVGRSRMWLKVIDQARRGMALAAKGNDLLRSRANVEAHYDLSGEMYDLFLDRDKQYSCAYFPTPETDLEEAQLAKKRHIAAKMRMDREELTTLDIGCGWGGMGLYLARHCRADVTGVTLSTEQHGIANRRAREEGIADHADFLLKDYRALERTFDRIVSVGMFEHVGRKNYAEFFDKSAKLLDENGVMLLHTIGQADGPSPTNAFIEKHIFPGGYIPSLSEIMPHIERAGLVVTDIEMLRLHYAETLKAWRARFVEHWDEAKALYDERFCRMWEFYLAASESAFRWQGLVVFQIQLGHRVDSVPVTRDYIYEEEARLKTLDSRNESASARVETEQKQDNKQPTEPMRATGS